MFKRYLHHSTSLSVGLVMTIPLLVLYELGLLVVGLDVLNGADVVTQEILNLFGQVGFLTFNAALLLGFGVGVVLLKRRKRFDFRFFGPLLVESTLYGFTMGFLIIALLDETRLLLDETGLLGPTLETGMLRNIVLSAGAGLHEELLFRLAMIPGLLALWKRITQVGGRPLAIIFAVVTSSLLFSLAHFMAEDPNWYRFAYRAAAGLVFAIVFLTRGFAVAAYTHTMYDIWVLEVVPHLQG
jgi:membrane protease YdiL (CAAX protease family)